MLDAEARERLTTALQNVGPISTEPAVSTETADVSEAPASSTADATASPTSTTAPAAGTEAPPRVDSASPTSRAPSPEKPSVSDTPKDEGLPEGAPLGDPKDHRIPYSRFKAVIDERNDYVSQIERLKRENADLKAREGGARAEPPRKEPPKAAAGNDDWLDSMLADDAPTTTPTASPVDARMDRYEQEQIKLRLDTEVWQAAATAPELTSAVLYGVAAKAPSLDLREKAVEWKKARAEFPDVDPVELQRAFLHDPSADLTKTARAILNWHTEQYGAFVAKYEAERRGTAPQQTQPPAAPPAAPPRVRDSGNPAPTADGTSKPKSIAEASSRVRDALRAASA